MKVPPFRFFHDQLPDDRQRAFYEAIENGIREHQIEILCPRILGLAENDYMHLLEHVYDDHPEFFYFYPLLSQITMDGLLIKVRPFYRYSAIIQAQYNAALDRAVACILSECFPNGWNKVTEIRREKAIFDWITKNVVYDQQSIDFLEEKQLEQQIRSVAWNAYGALVCREAVCEGIACAFKLLCDQVSLPSIVVLGQATGGRHAWNMVRINKKFYHVDCTWDLRSGISTQIPYMKYRYFNLPDRVIGVNHKAESSFLPVCGSMQYNPFRIRKLCAFSPQEADEIALRCFREGQRRFAIMTIGFSGIDYGETAAVNLSKNINSRVEYFVDSSGYFIGFVI